MVRVLLIIAVVMLTIYCVVEVAQTKSHRVRTFPKWLWAFAVIAVPVAGPLGWLFAGRPREAAHALPRQHAPDDDEDFLRGIR